MMNKIKFWAFIYLNIFALGINLSGEILTVPESALEKKKVKILTLNTAMLSVFFEKIDVGVKDNNSRAILIGQTIKRMSPQPDIIVFQEAFDSKAVQKILYKEIENLYPHAFFDTRTNAYFGGGVSSGLVILSKYPIVRKLQKDFDCWAGIEALARKGIMGAEIMVDRCPLYIFTAHLQAGIAKDWYIKLAGKGRDWLSKLKRTESRTCEGKKPSALSQDEIRSVELRQAKKEIDSFVKDKNAPILLAGDFNISPLRDSKYYSEMMKIFPGSLDTYLNGSQKIKSSSWKKGKVALTETDRLDYVLLLNPSSNVYASSNIIDNFTDKMTDHLGTLATVEFSCS